MATTIIDLFDFISGIDIDETVDVLPICHSTLQNNLQNILDSKEMKKRGKGNFFYYGKAGYYNAKEVGTIKNTNLPVCMLIYNYEKKLYKYQPTLHVFDSGRFPKYRIQGLGLSHFELLPSSVDTIRKYIKGFFGDNKNYLDCLWNSNLDNNDQFVSCRALQELINLYKHYKDDEEFKHDRRAFTIELKYSTLRNFFPDLIVEPLPKKRLNTEQEEEMRLDYIKSYKEKFNVNKIEIQFYSQTNKDQQSYESIHQIINLKEKVRSIISAQYQ